MYGSRGILLGRAIDGYIDIRKQLLITFKPQVLLRMHGKFRAPAFSLDIGPALRMDRNAARVIAVPASAHSVSARGSQSSSSAQ